jgi:hypothetical protein
MNTSFETGARFVIIDEVSATLERMWAAFDKFDVQITAAQKKLASIIPAEFNLKMKGAVDLFADLGVAADRSGVAMMSSMAKAATGVGTEFTKMEVVVGRSFTGFTSAADAAATNMVAAMARVDASIAASNATLAALATGMATTSAAAGTLAAGAAAAAGHRPSRPGSPGYSGGPHFGRIGTEIPGGHISIGGTPALAAAGVIGASIYEAAQVQDIIAKAGITGQLPMGGDFMNSKAAKSLRDLIQRGASTTGYSVEDVGEAFLGIERMLGGVDFDKRMSVMNTIMPYAGLEARMKEGTSLKDSFESFVGMAHMTGEYDPAKLKELAKSFAFTSINTTASLPQFEKTLSYSLPMLHNAMGMDAQSVMMMTAMAMNAGITSTKSGTWIRSFFENSEPAMGDSKEAKAHNAALQRIGMLDSQNRVTWRKTGADGSIDWTASIENMAGIVGSHIKGLPLDERLGTVKDIWGERGGGIAAMMGLDTFVDQMPIYAGKMRNFTGADSALDEYANNSPVQKGREALRDFENILVDIGEHVLPVVNPGLKALDDALRMIPDWWSGNKPWSETEAGKRVKSNSDWWNQQAMKLFGLSDGNAAPAPDDRASRARGSDYISPKAVRDMGLIPSFDGLPAGFHKTAFSNDNGATFGGSSPAEDIVFRGTYRALMQAVFGSRSGAAGGMDAMSGAGGIINASYETGDVSGGRSAGSAGIRALHNSIRYGHHSTTGGSDAAGRFLTGAPAGPAGRYRPVYHLGGADLDDRVINTIAGEVSTKNPAGVDAVINNMMNRVGTHGWGPSGNMLEVARAKGQYAGYRHASPAEAAFIRSRIAAIASGGVEDNTHGANSYRASFYHGPWYRKHADGAVIGGNRYGYESGVPNGPYAPYAVPHSFPSAPPTKPASKGVSGTSSSGHEPSMTMASMPPIIIEHHSHTHLDGKRVAKSVSRHMVDMAQNSTSNGGMDTRAMYGGGAVPLTDAA